MQIEVFEQPEGRHGKAEAWVRVQANELLDWPTVRDSLSVAQRRLLDSDYLPGHAGYHPHRPTAAEIEETGYAFEDWWIFKRKFPVNAASRL